jgi:CRISPR-associated protein Cmr1
MRTPPSSPAPRTFKPVKPDTARVELITRLFGGGAKVREVDPLSWIRSSAAKSAIRNWWRIGHAHEFDSLNALRKREEELFGAAGTYNAKKEKVGGPGVLEITTQSHMGETLQVYTEPPGAPINVALFPASGMGRPPAKIAPASARTTASINLTLLSADPKTREQILSGLRLWLTLGGVGARTRRGAGALAIIKREEAKELGLPVSILELEKFLREQCSRRSLPGSLSGVFCLARARKIFLGPIQESGEAAQKSLLAALRDARQDRPRPPKDKWGRSRWPEADAIRLKVDPGRKWGHAPDLGNNERYPRAALGLPIQVHFKTPPGEPQDHQILAAEPAGKNWHKLERYSSPILLRPVRIWENDRPRYVPVAVFTECTLPSSARPLVTDAPGEDLDPTDVVSSWDILHHANSTLQRIEAVFASVPGFRSL